MKRVSLFFVTVVLITAFAACNGAKKTEAPAEGPAISEVVESVPAPEETPAAPALSPAEMLKNFQVYAKSYGEAFNNLTKNPKKFSELSKQYKDRIDEMEKIKGELNKKQLADYQKALDIIFKVNRGGK